MEGEAKAAKEMTLLGAIKELNTLTRELGSLILGSPAEEATGKPAPRDVITKARDMVMSSNSRLRMVIKRLQKIGG